MAEAILPEAAGIRLPEEGTFPEARAEGTEAEAAAEAILCPPNRRTKALLTEGTR